MVSKSCNLFKGLGASKAFPFWASGYDYFYIELHDPVKTAFWFRLWIDSVVYDQVKTESLESQAEAEELNQSQSVRTWIFLMVCPSASASDSVWFSLGHEGNEATDSIKQSRKKWTRSDSSCTDSFKLMTPLATPILDFHKVLRALTSPLAIPTPTPSPVNLCTDAPGEGASVHIRLSGSFLLDQHEFLTLLRVALYPLGNALLSLLRE